MEDNSTRSRIIDAAEELFAVHGFAGTPVRAICNAAGANVAAVHYYFRGKEGVAEALFERRMVGLAARRKQLLDALDSKGGTPSVRSLIEVLILPLSELIHREGRAGLSYVRAFAGLLHDQPDLVWNIIDKYNAENMQRVQDGLSKALPDLLPGVLRHRLVIGGEALIYCLANPANFTLDAPGEDGRPSLDEFVSQLVDFLAGGFSAPGNPEEG